MASALPKLDIHNDFQQKVMHQAFASPFVVRNSNDVLAWRTAWVDALKSWHSPYKAIIDCSNLTIHDDSGDVAKSFERMTKFLEGFFLRTVVGFGFDAARGHKLLPFPVHATEDAAAAAAGLRGSARPKGAAADFRATIQLQNHFNQHVVEMTFSEPVEITKPEQVDILKSKLTNNLTQWHSKWNLLIDCTNFSFDPAARSQWEKMEKFFRGFFMKQILGYSPRGDKEQYPFTVYRARHNAAGRLESEGNVAGDDAVCRTTVVEKK